MVALPQTLERGVLIGSEPDNRGRADIKAVHKFAAAVVIDGRQMSVIATIRETKDGKFHYDLSREREEGRSETALRHGNAKLRRSALEGAFPSLNIEFEALESNISFPSSGLRGLSDVVGQILRAHGLDRAVSPKIVRNLLSASGIPGLGSYRSGEIKVNAGAADPSHVLRHEIIHALRDANL